MKKLIIAVACIVALASCSNENKTDNSSTSTPPASTNQPGNTAPQQPQIQVDPSQGGQPSNIQIQPQGGQAPADGGQAPKSGTINPPHGQPGHTCAVPPGQPIP